MEYLRKGNLSYTLYVYTSIVVFGFYEIAKSINLPLIKNDYNLSYTTQGTIYSTLNVTYMCTTLLSSFLLPKLRYKSIIIIAFSLTALGTTVSALTSNLSLILTGYYITYFGNGFLEIGMNCFLSAYFVNNSGTMISLFHGMYGVGAIVGPLAAAEIAQRYALKYRLFFMIGGVLYCMTLTATLFLDFDKYYKERKESTSRKSMTTMETIKDPLVLLFILILGLQTNTEMAASSWSVLYIENVLHLDATKDGGLFMTVFYIIFTFSRLFLGPVYERLGYINSMLLSTSGAAVFFIIGFASGVIGRYFLMVTGLFVSMFWPCLMCAIMEIYGEDASKVTSVVISIFGILNCIMDYCQGLINDHIGPAWGYRCSVFISIVDSLLILFVMRLAKRRKRERTESACVKVEMGGE